MDWLKAFTAVPESTIKELMTGGLGSGMYQNLASTFIKENIGWTSATHMIQSLKPDFDGATFGDVYYKVYQGVKQSEYISGMDPYETLPADRYIEAPLGRPVEYRYIGEANIYEPDTGKTYKTFFSYFSNDELSIAEAGSLLYDAFSEDIDSPKMKNMLEKSAYIQNIKLVNIEHNEAW